MLIFVLVLIRTTFAQQLLCYAGPGDVYTGNVSLTDRGDVCEKWSSQKLIKLNEPIDHNFCRVLLQMSSRPYCVYNGQKRSCNVPTCDRSTLRFKGASFLLTRTDPVTYYPILAQQIKLYFQISELKVSPAVLVKVESQQDPSQHMSLVIKNGYLSVVVSLHFYFVEKFVFGGPVSVGEVHYVAVNRYRNNLTVQLNQTTLHINLNSKESTFLVYPYQITVGDNYFGCMTGLSVGTWVRKEGGKLDLFADKPLQLYTASLPGKALDDFTIQLPNTASIRSDMCMFAPTTRVTNHYDDKPKSDTIRGNSLQASDVLSPVNNGVLDRRSVIIISTAVSLVMSLALLTLVCVKKNQHTAISRHSLDV